MQSTTTVQNLGEMILTSAIEQSEEGYNEWRKILNNWVEDCKKSSQYFQNTIERDLKEMEEFLSSRKKQ
jgi:hypothetical protein